MKFAKRSMPVAIALLSLAGCSREALAPAPLGQMWIADSSEREQMKVALSTARIHFEVRKDLGNREEIWYDTRFQDQVLGIRDELFGTAPPNGRNMRLRAKDAAVFGEEMRKRGAAFRTGTFHGSSYVAWEAESDEAADAVLTILSVSSITLAEMKRIRQLVDAEQRDRTNRSNRSRDRERAPSER